MSGEELLSVPVLIVGAGPAGLTTAIMLARQGIGSLLVERRDDASDLPRATLVSTRSMELFRSWGLESLVRAGSVGVASALWVTHTLVRSALGIPMHGPDRLLECVTALFEAPLWEVVGERRYGVYWVEHAEAKGNFLPAGGDRWLYGRVWEPGRERVADYPADRLIRLIRLGAGVPELAPRLLRMGAYSFAAQLANRFRDRRVFLAGDAAHRITPRGGTGMNTAIHDGYDLGWKLAWTLHGWAGPNATPPKA